MISIPAGGNISAQKTHDGEVLISWSNYPLSGMICVPAAQAVQLASQIYDLAGANDPANYKEESCK